MSNVSEWDVSAANNTSAAPNGAPEGMAPSGVNDTIREMMAAVSRWYQDGNASLVTGGSSNTYTLTTNSSHSSLSDQSILVFRADRANSGAATLNVDGLGAKSIRANGEALDAGQIAEDVVYIAAYNRTDDAYDLIGAFTVNASALTTGELSDDRLSDNVPLLDDSSVDFSSGTLAWGGGSSIASSDNVPLKGSANTFTANATWTDNDEVRLGTGGDLRLYHDGTDSYIDNDTGDLVITSVGDITLNGVDVTDYARKSQSNTFTASGSSASTAPINLEANDNTWLRFDTAGGDENEKVWILGANTLSFSLRTRTDADSGGQTAMDVTRSGTAISTVNFPNGELQYGGIEVGYRGVPSAGVKGGDYTIQGSDRGKLLIYNGSGGDTFTMPASITATGELITILNAGTGNLTIAESSYTLRWVGVGTTGNRTLSQHGLCQIIPVGASSGYIAGTGLS